VDLCNDDSVPPRKKPAEITKPVTSLENALNQASSVDLKSNTNKSTSVSVEVQMNRTRRVMKEMRALLQNSHPAFDVFPCVDDIFFWRMTMEGPSSTPYKDGVWVLYVRFPEEYPSIAPEIRFITPIKHCNVNCYGRICHSILDRNYTADTTMMMILQCIYGLLLSPDVTDPLDSTLALEFYDDSGQYEASILQHVKTHAKTKTRLQWRDELGK